VAAAPDEARRGRGARALKLALGFIASAAFLYAMLHAVPLRRVGEILGSADPRWIAAAFAFLIADYWLKTWRWTLMLQSLGAGIRVRDAATPFLGALAFNNVLPLRAGDVIRVVAFQRFTGIPPSGQLGTLALERLLDLFILMAILFATITLWQVDVLDDALLVGLQLAALAVAGAIILFIAAPAWIRILVRWGEERLPKLRPAGEALLRLSDAISILSRPLLLSRLVAISLIAWLAEGAMFFAAGCALGVAASPEAALLALSIGTLSTIIPSAPGYVGTFHYFTARVALAFGAVPAAAAAYAILVHALHWVPVTLSGFLLLALSGTRARRTRLNPADQESLSS
jgi:hypothetical protein